MPAFAFSYSLSLQRLDQGATRKVAALGSAQATTLRTAASETPQFKRLSGRRYPLQPYAVQRRAAETP